MDSVTTLQADQDLLSEYEETWDIERKLETYARMGQRDPAYMVYLLFWLCQYGFLDRAYEIVSTRGEAFFSEFPMVPEDVRKYATDVARWLSSRYRDLKAGDQSVKMSPVDKEILNFWFANDLQGLRSYIEKNGRELFSKRHRDQYKTNTGTNMVKMFSLSILGEHDLISDEIAYWACQFAVSKYRSRRVLELISKNVLADPPLGNASKFLEMLLLLLHRANRGDGAKGRWYQGILLKKTSELVSLRQPLTLESPNYPGMKSSIVKSGSKRPLFKMFSPGHTFKSRAKAGLPHIAVCISGMTRGSDAYLKSLKKRVVHPLKADVFVSTWDVHQKWPDLTLHPRLYNLTNRYFAQAKEFVLDELALGDAFKNTFPTVFEKFRTEINDPLAISHYSNVFPLTAYTIENEETFLNNIPYDISKLEYNGTFNQIKMFHLMHSSLQLALEHERKTGMKYDFIIRARPDIKYSSGIDMQGLHNLSEDDIAINITQYGPNDYFWIGRRDAAIKSNLFWNQIYASRDYFIFHQQCHSHRLVAFYFSKHGLRTVNGLIKIGLSDPFNVLPYDIRNELKKDFAGPAKKYRENEKLRRYFEAITGKTDLKY